MSGERHWITTWTSSPLGPGPMPRPYGDGFDRQTVRMVLRNTSAGGSAARIWLSNWFGDRAVTFANVTLGLHDDGAALVPGSGCEVTFGGRGGVTIARGAVAVSDPVTMEIPGLAPLVLSLHAAAPTGPVTAVVQGVESFVADGDRSHEDGADGFTAVTTATGIGGVGYFATAVDVLAEPEVPGTIVGFGDSITAMGWPGLLAERIARSGERPFAVTNAGIGGNRVLRDGIGDSALARMDRDVLSQHGVKAVIYMQGVNDLGFPYIANMEVGAALATAFDITDPALDDLIAGHRQIIDRAHARGIPIFGSVLTPYRDAAYWTESGEQKRRALNTWIRDESEYDAVLDFASAVGDPADPERLRTALDAGDHLHPNPDGQQALADSIDLALFRDL